MSEDRTQPASKRRRQLAREQGQVAHSPELTAAAGWLSAVVALGVWGPDLMEVLVDLTRAPLVRSVAGSTDPAALAALVRGDVLRIAPPLGMILGGFLVGAFAAHQAQVRGLWAPALIAPDASRLGRVGQGGGLSARFERSLWSIVKVVILTAVAWWGIRSRWGALQGLSLLDFPTAAQSAMAVLLGPMRVLAVLMVVVGLVDYGLRFARFEMMLRTTPDEHREDQKAIEGDPRLRSSRRRLGAVVARRDPGTARRRVVDLAWRRGFDGRAERRAAAGAYRRACDGPGQGGVFDPTGLEPGEDPVMRRAAARLPNRLDAEHRIGPVGDH